MGKSHARGVNPRLCQQRRLVPEDPFLLYNTEPATTDRDASRHLVLRAEIKLPEGKKRTDEPEASELRLAEKLEVPVEEVHEQLVEGRAELQQRFLAMVNRTVPNAELAPIEAAHLLVYTRALFSSVS